MDNRNVVIRSKRVVDRAIAAAGFQTRLAASRKICERVRERKERGEKERRSKRGGAARREGE
jgi:hypothetical protein